MFNSTSDENVSVSDVHIGLDTSHDLEYIEEDYTNSTYEDLNNYTTKDYCLVSWQDGFNPKSVGRCSKRSTVTHPAFVQ